MNRPIIDLVGDGFREKVFLRIVNLAADLILGHSRGTNFLAPGGVELGDRGHGWHQAQQTRRIHFPFIERFGTPRQQRRPRQLALDFLDVLADFRRGGFGLFLLNSCQQNVHLPIRKPDIQEAVGDQGGTHDSDEEANIFAKQLPARGRRSGGL
jgi:hypothetical protein